MDEDLLGLEDPRAREALAECRAARDKALLEAKALAARLEALALRMDRRDPE